MEARALAQIEGDEQWARYWLASLSLFLIVYLLVVCNLRTAHFIWLILNLRVIYGKKKEEKLEVQQKQLFYRKGGTVCSTISS
jgi:hypothetical protein